MALAKYVMIKQFITGQIESRAWAENSLVPSENTLAREFSVSRMTARRALQELANQGVLTRTQGLGTFVASVKSQSSALTIRNIADEIRQRGHRYHCHPITLDSRAATTTIGIALEVPAQTPVYYSALIHCENGLPLQLEQRHVNPLLAGDYLAQDFSRQTPHEYLSAIAPLTQARHTIEAVSPSTEQCRWLELTQAQPCLLITRRTWSQQGVVSYAKLICPGSRYRLDSHLTFDDESD
jgi:GntR family histidine utilization transcriptional repressor